MYISFSNEPAAKAIVMEIIYNAIDECRSPRSPANKVTVEFDERTGFIRVTDNGRGIPTDKFELILTTLNSGSNITSDDKVDLKTNVLGRNGVGTLAMTALAERIEVTSYRGGTENIAKLLIFEEGTKVKDETWQCKPDKHGLEVLFKPSKVLGKSTRIVWEHIHQELINLQFLEETKITLTSTYTDKRGNEFHEKYKIQPFVSILDLRNGRETITGDRINITVSDDGIREEVGGKSYKRFVQLNVAFAYTNATIPYIDSFCNGNNTIDNGSHLDGTMEAICRFFQQATKASLPEKEKSLLDIKWDDVKTGLSVAVLLNTNMEQIFTGQTKHKVQNDELEKLLRDLVIDGLQTWGESNVGQLREFISTVKLNARARRESDKIKGAVIKDSVTNWGAFRMKNYDPCTAKGKEYKELYIVEGDSAKGSLKLARDSKFQALFAVRGVSANVFKLDINGVLANKEFNDLIKIMGCNVGSKFDINRLTFNKIIIASDADSDGLGIRGLLMSFFFKIYPEIVLDGRLFIAEPPLYRVNNKKNPFVINKEDYVNRYVSDVVKNYQLAFFQVKKDELPQFLSKSKLREFLEDTSTYVDELALLAQHYKVNEQLLEMVLVELAYVANYELNIASDDITHRDLIERGPNIQRLMNAVGETFQELHYDDNDRIIMGIADGKYQSLEISDRLVRKGFSLINMMMTYPLTVYPLTLREIKGGNESKLSLLGTLKILRRYQPDIIRRFKGLGVNTDEDIRLTIMDPNTRMLIRVNIVDMENDQRIFNVLRGNAPADIQARRKMMREYVVPRELIDT